MATAMGSDTWKAHLAMTMVQLFNGCYHVITTWTRWMLWVVPTKFTTAATVKSPSSLGSGQNQRNTPRHLTVDGWNWRSAVNCRRLPSAVVKCR